MISQENLSGRVVEGGRGGGDINIVQKHCLRWIAAIYRGARPVQKVSVFA